MTIPTCHPDRTHRGHGLCRTCYGRESSRKRRAAMGPATCHPDRRAKVKSGLCQQCYHRQRGYSRTGRVRVWGPYDPEVGRRKRLAKYGLTPADFDRLAAEQGGRCALCGESGPLRVDHDHATGVRRSLLCNNCNTGLGFFRDDPVRLDQAAAYLRLHRVERSA